MLRYQFQILDGVLASDNSPGTDSTGEQMRDGWYSGLEEDYTGPFEDEKTAEYVSFLLDESDSLLGRGETGGRLDALIDLRSHIQKRVEDLTT